MRPDDDENDNGEESFDMGGNLLEPSSAAKPSMDQARREEFSGSDRTMKAEVAQSTALRGAMGGQATLPRKARYQADYKELNRRQ